MQLIYSDESETHKVVNIDMKPYKGKIVVLITSGGGLYTIACLESLKINTIKEDKSVSYVGSGRTTTYFELIIAFKGIINLFAIK